VFVCASRQFYDEVTRVRAELERRGHLVTLPNNFDDPGREARMKDTDDDEFAAWKAEMLQLQAQKVADNDAVLIVNLDKDGRANYLGGATFLELFKAWELGKKRFLYNPIPDGILHDEIAAMRPTVINGDFDRIV
jgi:hypothetical protein